MSTPAARRTASATAAAAVKQRVTFRKVTTLTKLATDHRLGVIMGFLFTSKVRGEDYYDLHGHHIPESEIVPAALYFAKHGDMDVMHDRQRVGSVPFVWPYSTEFAKAVGNDKPLYTGLLVGVMPDDPKILTRVDAGELVAFSLDGTGYETET